MSSFKADLTNNQLDNLVTWAARLSPNPRLLPAYQNQLDKWEHLKGEQNDPYDEDYCDLHIALLKLQKEQIVYEMAVLSSDRSKITIDVIGDLAKSHKQIIDTISDLREQIHATEMADSMIGKRALRIK